MSDSKLENKPAGEPLSFEKVWAMFQESDRKFQESDRKFQKDREKDREEAREEHRRFKEEHKLRMEELERQIKENELQRKEAERRYELQKKDTDRRMGYLSNRFGELAEHLVGPSIMEKFNELGFHFTERGSVEITEPGDPIVYAEIDILLGNGDIAIAVEVKSKPKQSDIDDHLNRMKILRRAGDRHYDKRKFRGAIAGAIMTNEVRNYAFKKGLYVIEQSGDTVRINIPDNFIPTEW